MKKKIFPAITAILLAFSLTACSLGQEAEQFRSDIEAFCTSVSSINESINKIDASDENAPQIALDYLDQLDKAFQDFAALDFPADYDILEDTADDAGQYMAEAVRKYHQAYEGESYDEAAAAQAREASSKAFKLIQALLDVLRNDIAGSGNGTGSEGSANGASVNGASANGTSANGTSVNGTSVNGTSANGN